MKARVQASAITAATSGPTTASQISRRQRTKPPGSASSPSRSGTATTWASSSLGKYPDAFDGVTVSSLRAAQEAVSKGRWRENSQATDWVGIPIANALGLDPTNEAHKAKIKKLLKTWTENGMFVVEELDDTSRKRPFVKVGKLAND